MDAEPPDMAPLLEELLEVEPGCYIKTEEATRTIAVSSSSGTGHPEVSSPVKKVSHAELFGELLKTQVGNKPT